MTESLDYPLFAIVDPATEKPLINEINGTGCVALYQRAELAELFRRQTEEVEPDRPLALLTLADSETLGALLSALPRGVDRVVWYGTPKPGEFRMLPVAGMLQSLMPAKPDGLGQARVAACRALQRKIMDRWRQCGEFDCRVVATQSPLGKSVDQLRRIVLSVTVDGETVELLPNELLVVLDLVRRESESPSLDPDQTGSQCPLSIKTDFSDDEAFELLAGCPIEWPGLQGHLT